jgi:hypothetical protein
MNYSPLLHQQNQILTKKPGMRTTLLNTREPESITPQTRTYVSTVSGALTFAMVGAVTRKLHLSATRFLGLIYSKGGRKNVIPGTIMGSLLGFTGQCIYNALDAHNTKSLSEPVKEPIWRRAMKSEWSPVKALTDEEYSKILQDKLLRVEVDIAVIDDDIAMLKEKQRKESTGRTSVKDQ